MSYGKDESRNVLLLLLLLLLKSIRSTLVHRALFSNYMLCSAISSAMKQEYLVYKNRMRLKSQYGLNHRNQVKSQPLASEALCTADNQGNKNQRRQEQSCVCRVCPPISSPSATKAYDDINHSARNKNVNNKSLHGLVCAMKQLTQNKAAQGQNLSLDCRCRVMENAMEL